MIPLGLCSMSLVHFDLKLGTKPTEILLQHKMSRVVWTAAGGGRSESVIVQKNFF